MKRETIAPASIQYFPLAQLYVSDLNPRQDADPEGIDLLADSLATIGLIQNLSGILDAEGRVGIVAGGRGDGFAFHGNGPFATDGFLLWMPCPHCRGGRAGFQSAPC